jgi:hypothetical protein
VKDSRLALLAARRRRQVQAAANATDLDRLRALATRVVNDHVDDGTGLCRMCSSAFPCPKACLAEGTWEFVDERPWPESEK